jgi:acetylornithine deacetylase/succinyl-diaminopimelate desuccinylase-like protein
MLEPLLSFTLSPTMIEASRQRNVIPAICDIEVDCRMLPGQAPRDVEPLIRAALGDGDYQLDWIEAPSGGTRSPLDTPLWRALERWVAKVEPGAQLVPVLCAGFTDSHWLREARDTVAYGFFPLKAMDPVLAGRLVHSADERIAIEDLELGVDLFRDVVLSLTAT